MVLGCAEALPSGKKVYPLYGRGLSLSITAYKNIGLGGKFKTGIFYISEILIYDLLTDQFINLAIGGLIFLCKGSVLYLNGKHKEDKIAVLGLILGLDGHAHKGTCKAEL